jgi:transposase InsO family protein
MSISSKTDSNLAINALYGARSKRNITLGIILHSDQGSLYASESFQNNLALYSINVSMSSRGNCYNNSMVESFFGTLKTGLEWNQKFDSTEQARASIFEYIECWYNNKRRHSSLGYLSPKEFEEQYYKNRSYDYV